MRIYPNKLKPIQYINKIPYLITANIPIQQVKDVTLIKEWLECETAFKNNNLGLFIFCNEIEEIKFEEIEQNEQL